MDENTRKVVVSMLNTLRMTTECYCSMNTPPKSGYRDIAESIETIKDFIMSSSTPIAGQAIRQMRENM